MAGAEGFEPPLAVLETAGLPLNLRPCSEVVSGQLALFKVRAGWTVECGRWSVVSGQWSVDSGRWSVVSGQRDLVNL